MVFLDHRCTGGLFQIAIPADLRDRIGKSSIRIPHGAVPAPFMHRAARSLSGHAEHLFIVTGTSQSGPMSTDPRDVIIAEFTAQIDGLIHSFEQ